MLNTTSAVLTIVVLTDSDASAPETGVAGWQIGLIVAFSIMIVIGVIVLVVVLRRQDQNPTSDLHQPDASAGNAADAQAQLAVATPSDASKDVYADINTVPEWMMSSARSVPSSDTSGTRGGNDVYTLARSQGSSGARGDYNVVPATDELRYVSLASTPLPGLGDSGGSSTPLSSTPVGSRKFSNQPPVVPRVVSHNFSSQGPPPPVGSRKFGGGPPPPATATDDTLQSRNVSMRAPKANYDSLAIGNQPTAAAPSNYHQPERRDMYTTLPSHTQAAATTAPSVREKNYIPLNEV